KAQELVESLIYGAFRVFLLERLLPFVGQARQLFDGLSLAEANGLAVNRARAAILQLVKAIANKDEIRVHEFDQRATKKKIEADEGEHGRRVVEHSSGGFLHAAALLDEIRLQQILQALEAAQRNDHFFERLAPRQGRGIHFPEDRPENVGDI